VQRDLDPVGPEGVRAKSTARRPTV